MIVPIGEFSDISGPLLGGTLRLGYDATPQFQVFVRGGYQRGLGVDGQAVLGPATYEEYLQTGDPFQVVAVTRWTSAIPVYFGGRYFFMKPRSGIYGSAELGLNVLRYHVKYGSNITSESQARIGVNLGAGYVISDDFPLNIGVQIAHLNLLGSKNGEDGLIGASVQAGYEVRF